MRYRTFWPLLLLLGCSSASSQAPDDTTSSASTALITAGAMSLPAGCGSPQGIVDPGYAGFRVSDQDVDGDGVDDYCRFVGDSPNIFLSCQPGCPGGNYGSPYAFNSIPGIDQGYGGLPRWLTDIDGDGRADFCRWVGDSPNIFFSCDLAGASGFDASEYEVSLPPNVQPLVLTIEQIEPQTPLENRPVWIHFALTNNLPYPQKGFVGAQMFPKHGSEYNDVWGEWQVLGVPANQTIRGVAMISAPRADPGVSANVYFVGKHEEVGEFDIQESEHLVESAPQSFDVAARYEISVDDVNVNHTRALYTDTDYVGMALQVNGATAFDDSGAPQFIGNFGDGVHPVGLVSTPFDLVPSDSSSIDLRWTVVNNGAHAEAMAQKILNGISSIAAGVLSIAYPGTGQTWTKVDDFTQWLNSQQFAGCDGPVALDHMSATSNVLEYKTYDDQSAFHDFHDTRYYDWNGGDSAYNSQDGCGSSPRYAVDWTIHRLASDAETEWASPMQGMVKPGGTVQFSTPDANVHWSVDGDAYYVGWIDDQTGLYHAPASLPVSTLIEVRVETADGSKHGVAFVALDPR